MSVFLSVVCFAFVLLVAGCTSGAKPGTNGQAQGYRNESIGKLAGDINVIPAAEMLDKGRVLMSYSDCFICHKETDRKRGPAFKDIASRYPMNSTYIRILSKRVILGAKGSWGNVVMPPHPMVSEEDAEKMVMYILSLD